MANCHASVFIAGRDEVFGSMVCEGTPYIKGIFHVDGQRRPHSLRRNKDLCLKPCVKVAAGIHTPVVSFVFSNFNVIHVLTCEWSQFFMCRFPFCKILLHGVSCLLVLLSLYHCHVNREVANVNKIYKILSEMYKYGKIVMENFIWYLLYQRTTVKYGFYCILQLFYYLFIQLSFG